jgi:hypothetical protein
VDHKEKIMTDLETKLEEVLSAADKERATGVADHEWDSLYPSIRQMKQSREASKTIPTDDDVRTLESCLYHKSLKKMRVGR